MSVGFDLVCLKDLHPRCPVVRGGNSEGRKKNLKVLIKVTVGAGESEEGTKKPEAEEGWRCSSERGAWGAALPVESCSVLTQSSLKSAGMLPFQHNLFSVTLNRMFPVL